MLNLDELKKQGKITNEEYEAQRAKLLISNKEELQNTQASIPKKTDSEVDTFSNSGTFFTFKLTRIGFSDADKDDLPYWKDFSSYGVGIDIGYQYFFNKFIGLRGYIDVTLSTLKPDNGDKENYVFYTDALFSADLMVNYLHFSKYSLGSFIGVGAGYAFLPIRGFSPTYINYSKGTTTEKTVTYAAPLYQFKDGFVLSENTKHGLQFEVGITYKKTQEFAFRPGLSTYYEAYKSYLESVKLPSLSGVGFYMSASWRI